MVLAKTYVHLANELAMRGNKHVICNLNLGFRKEYAQSIKFWLMYRVLCFGFAIAITCTPVAVARTCAALLQELKT